MPFMPRSVYSAVEHGEGLSGAGGSYQVENRTKPNQNARVGGAGFVDSSTAVGLIGMKLPARSPAASKRHYRVT